MNAQKPMKPTIGRIVYYRLGSFDVDAIEHNRSLAKTAGFVNQGNDVHAGDIYPAMIVRLWHPADQAGEPTECAQLQVFLDGYDTLWATSRQQDVVACEKGELPAEGKWIPHPRLGD